LRKNIFGTIFMNAKQLAAEHAVKLIQEGMTVGIGTGTTSAYAIEAISKRIKEGLSIKAVASSNRSEGLAKGAGITLIPFSEFDEGRWRCFAQGKNTWLSCKGVYCYY
jgi:ribose 5-phosphate isomerase